MMPDKRLPRSADGGTAPPKASTSHCRTASSTSWGFLALSANLNPSNRPVRTRMPGGVAGDVEPSTPRPYADRNDDGSEAATAATRQSSHRQRDRVLHLAQRKTRFDR